MNKLLAISVAAAVLTLSACGQKDQAAEQQTAPTKESLATQEQKKPTAQKQLLSGINFENIDDSVRPQDDFYNYINGNWLKTAKIPADKSSVGAFISLRDKSDEDVNTIIEDLAKQTDLAQGSDEQKVADLFRSYMDTETLEKLGTNPIQSDLDKINAIQNKDQLFELFTWSSLNGGGSPLAFYVGVDAKDSEHYAAHVWQDGLHLPDRDYYLKDTDRFKNIRAEYLKHIAKMFDLAGLKNGDQAAQSILDLETKIAEKHWTRVATRDSEKRYNKFKTSELNQLSDKINWSVLLQSMGLSDLKELIINQPDYIQALGEIIESTPLETWKTYMVWQILDGNAGNLNKALDDQNFAFYGTVLNGREEQLPRWRRGVKVVNRNLGEVVGKIYVGKHFKPEAKQRMVQLVENLRSAYGKSIDELDWMSPETKKAAHEKLAAFTPKVGYPDKWEDYSQLNIKSDDLIGNIRRSIADKAKKDIERLKGPVRDWEWGMTPQTVNAYYSPTRNEVVFPAAILQPPFFNMEADDAVNYGGIGAVIGHEMGHGFDDQGSRYDGHGNLKNWWSEKDLKEFKARTQKLVDQFNGYYPFKDLHVNGELTLGENIGDLSGLTISYKAYQMSLDGKPAPVIDNLTGDQRFFMGFAQIWRGKMREKAQRNRINTDPHSPGHFRAIGSLSNMPEFYKVYDVKEGDKMYIPPQDRVKIW
ncbi:MAG: M13 family metallopeptidase [bacterium]